MQEPSISQQSWFGDDRQQSAGSDRVADERSHRPPPGSEEGWEGLGGLGGLGVTGGGGWESNPGSVGSPRRGDVLSRNEAAGVSETAAVTKPPLPDPPPPPRP